MMGTYNTIVWLKSEQRPAMQTDNSHACAQGKKPYNGSEKPFMLICCRQSTLDYKQTVQSQLVAEVRWVLRMQDIDSCTQQNGSTTHWMNYGTDQPFVDDKILVSMSKFLMPFVNKKPP